jgi:hypothetical protein
MIIIVIVDHTGIDKPRIRAIRSHGKISTRHRRCASEKRCAAHISAIHTTAECDGTDDLGEVELDDVVITHHKRLVQIRVGFDGDDVTFIIGVCHCELLEEKTFDLLLQLLESHTNIDLCRPRLRTVKKLDTHFPHIRTATTRMVFVASTVRSGVLRMDAITIVMIIMSIIIIVVVAPELTTTTTSQTCTCIAPVRYA